MVLRTGNDINNYRPFGLTFNSYQRENSVTNQYLYNGKEKQDKLDLWMVGLRSKDDMINKIYQNRCKPQFDNYLTTESFIMETKPRIRHSYLTKDIFLLFLFLTLLGGTAAGQNGDRKDIIPPSPNIATLKRFLDYPVDHSTGLADVTIPLYEIKLKDFSFPVAMSFHASGRRMNLDYSPLGVGWTLNSFGYLSREVRERPDEDYQSLEMTANDISSLGLEQAYNRLLNTDMSVPNGHLPGLPNESSKEDAEHDIYTYSANGISGKFVFDVNNSPFPLTHNSHKIFMSLGTPMCTVADERGTMYNFGGTPNAVEWLTPVNGVSHPSSWLLSGITTPSGESITFNYETRATQLTDDNIEGAGRVGNEMTFGSPEQITEVCSMPEVANFNSNLAGVHVNPTFSGYNYTISYLKEIVFNHGKITFIYDTPTLRLTGFQVTDNNNQVVRSANFSYIQTPGTTQYIPNNNDRSLSTLQFLGSDNQPVEKYSFDYYNAPLPYPSYLYPTTDWWGYCTNISPGGDTPPVDPIADAAAYGQWTISDRTPSLLLKKSGMLKKIIYPTGGNTEFVYEANIYRGYNNQPQEGPGLRIQQIISDDGTGTNKITKLYKYGSNEDGMGTLPRLPSPADFVSQRDYLVYDHAFDSQCAPLPGVNNYYGNYRVRTYSPIPTPEMREAYSQPVYYENVTEYTVSQNGDKNGKTEYSYSIPQYTSFTEFFRKKEWTSSKLSTVLVHRYRPAQNDYQPVERTILNYNQFHYSKIAEVKIVRNTFLKQDDGWDGRPIERALVVNNGGSFYTYTDNPVESAVDKIIYKEHTSIDNLGNEVTTINNYFYDNQQHMLPTRVVTTLSNGKSLESKTSYPPDINTGDYSLMANRNMLNYPVEQTTLVNSQVTASSLTTYKTAGTSYGPDKTYSVETPSPLSSFTWFNGSAKDSRYANIPEIGFDSYDNKSNILQTTSKSGIVTSYFWSYDQTLPVVQAQNISQEDLVTNVTTAATNAGLNTSTWISDPQSEKIKWQNFNTLLRSYCGVNVLVTTYTYKLLIGTASITDSNSITTYYEYDSFGRLILLKDKDLNIIKKYEYHYKTQ